MKTTLSKIDLAKEIKLNTQAHEATFERNANRSSPLKYDRGIAITRNRP
jgi:hypothetical protein